MRDEDLPRALNAVLRKDLVAFIEKCIPTLAPALVLMRNWHIEAIAHHLQLCLDGKIRRLIITVPPRSLKSVCASVAFPAWVLAHQPHRKLVCVSYSAELAAAFGRDSKEIMDAKWYRDLFLQTRISRRRSAEMDFMTTKRGGRLATSVGGTLTGRGGSFIVIDDAMKADDVTSDVRRNQVIQWFRETLITRLDDKRHDTIIVIMQRLHVDDLVGHLLRTGEWVHLNLPAIAQHDEAIEIGPNQFHHRKKGDLLHPEREGPEEYAELERSLGSRAFAAQYLQEPIAPDGNILRLSWFKGYDELPEWEGTDEIVQSWDTASKAGLSNDYSVCTTWLIREEQYYLLDLFRGRLEYPDLRRKVIDLAQEWNVDRVLIEDASSGQALLQDLQKRPEGARWWLEAIKFHTDKVQRAEAQAVPLEAGQVFLKRGAPYLAELRTEILNFPRGHDDQVDSITQFLHWVRTRIIYATEIPFSWGY